MNWLFHQAALGDFVLTFPILRGLDGPVRVVTHPSMARLAARIMSHVQPDNADDGRWCRLFAPDADAEPIDADLVISFVSNGRDAWADNMRRLAPRAKLVFVTPRPPAQWRRHVTDWHRRHLVEQGVHLKPLPLPLHGGEAGEGGGRQPSPSNPIIIHPGSGSPRKCWPPEQFRELARALPHAQLIVGEVERDAWPEARFLATLDELHGALSSASLYIGNDSGPTHLAAQMGLPTIALFGPTLPGVWGPRGSRVTLLAPPRPSDMTWLDVSTVLAAAQRTGQHRHR